MLDRAHRLTSGRMFAATIRQGRRAGRSTVVLHLAESQLRGEATGKDASAADSPPRVGLVVGKAVGNAVTRNQVKRRLRHIARERLESLPGGALLVLRALPPAAAASSATLGRDVDEALSRLLLRGPA
jgi:ribonuclease P protein component